AAREAPAAPDRAGVEPRFAGGRGALRRARGVGETGGDRDVRLRLSLVRFLLEASFLILVAAAVGLAGLARLWIAAIMFCAWLLVALLERGEARSGLLGRAVAEPVAQEKLHEPEPAPEPEAEPEPEPVPEPEPEPQPQPESEPEPVVLVPVPAPEPGAPRDPQPKP